jgi:hypothetical protein
MRRGQRSVATPHCPLGRQTQSGAAVVGVRRRAAAASRSERLESASTRARVGRSASAPSAHPPTTATADASRRPGRTSVDRPLRSRGGRSRGRSHRGRERARGARRPSPRGCPSSLAGSAPWFWRGAGETPARRRHLHWGVCGTPRRRRSRRSSSFDSCVFSALEATPAPRAKRQLPVFAATAYAAAECRAAALGSGVPAVLRRGCVPQANGRRWLISLSAARSRGRGAPRRGTGRRRPPCSRPGPRGARRAFPPPRGN